MSNLKLRTDLKKVKIGKNITSIKPKCFMTCYNISEVIIPTNVIDIGNDAFKGLTLLTAVNFIDRTKEEVNAIIQNIADIGIIRTDIVKDKNGMTILPSKLIKITYLDGTKYQQGIRSNGLTRNDITKLNYALIKTIDLIGEITLILEQTFLDCDNLTDISISAEINDVVSKVKCWNIGIDHKGNTHLVLVHCKNGTIIINANRP